MYPISIPATHNCKRNLFFFCIKKFFSLDNMKPPASKSKLAHAIQQAATKIKLKPTSRPLLLKSRDHPKLLQQRRDKVPLTKSYHSPLYKHHFIPQEHIPPPMYIRSPPRVIDLVKNTSLKHIVKEDESYEIPQILPDKFAVIAPWTPKLILMDI